MRAQPLNDFEPVSTNDAEQLINKGKTLRPSQPLFSNPGRHTGRSVEIRPYKFLIRKFCKVSKIICDHDEQDTNVPRTPVGAARRIDPTHDVAASNMANGLDARR